MTIRKFLQTKEITPQELKDNFELFRTIEDSTFSHQGCFNCGDVNNNEKLRVGAWHRAQYCMICNTISLVYVQDRMSGALTDIIEVYKEKS